MIKLSKLDTTQKILGLIILIGAVLRFWNLWGLSLSNDELSALSRLRFDNLHDLALNGIAVDGHPGGVQFFLYFWTKIFGISPVSIRFPFVLAGIASLYIAYLVSSRWFSKTTGLFVAASMALLQFPILYSQLARPYSFGLLFSLLAVWFWTRLLFDEKSKKLYLSIGFALSVAACMYTHYFSFLFAGIVALSGLFFIRKHNFLWYLGSLFVAVALFLPHLQISLYQFGVGGVGGWLPKPGTYWLLDFIEYCFNDSELVYLLIAETVVIMVFSVLRWVKFNKFHLLCVVWFMIPFLIGYYYSIKVNPVLQNSVLLFSFPFLLIFIFSIHHEKKQILYRALLAILVVIMFISTVFEKKYYSAGHFGEFKKLADYIVEWDEKYGKENISHAINVNNPFYINYYLDRYDHKVNFLQTRNDGEYNILKLKKQVESCTTPYFAYGWSTKVNYDEIYDIIKEKFPAVIETHVFFNSEIYLFGKDISKDVDTTATSGLKLFQGFEDGNIWGHPASGLDTTVVKTGKYSYRFDSNMEYGPTYRTQLSDVPEFKKIRVSVEFMPVDPVKEALVVVTIDSDSSSIDWRSINAAFFITKPGWNTVFFEYPYPQNYLFNKNDKLGIYVWNVKKSRFFIDDMKVEFLE